ncbi:MAG: hypothetical protein EXQ70_07210 [Solirubrobacterales bacterium]|nr:hypothetical protein [Solirubrobacterales bacterium]
MYRLSSRITDQVMQLLETDLSDYEIARRTGASRSTVQRWRRMSLRETARAKAESLPGAWRAWKESERLHYSYLLGRSSRLNGRGRSRTPIRKSSCGGLLLHEPLR